MVNVNNLTVDPKTTSPTMGMSSLFVPKFKQTDLRKLHQFLVESRYVAALDLLSSLQPAQKQDLDQRLNFLKRLFLNGEGFPFDEVSHALTPLNPDLLLEAGLFQQSNDQVKALFQVQVYNGLLFIADFMPREHPADLVLPIGPSGKYLASVTIRKPVKSALDLGCGCGIQALLLAQHAGHVIATDINSRALALTRLNADLNGITNIEILEGSYFEPVRGRTFDVIVANLPYVITPENKYIYRDISQGSDNSVKQTVQQIPSYLTEGGYAHLMLNWIHREDQPWWQPVEDWIANHNADAWLLYTNSMTPEEYSRQWILISEKDKPDEYGRIKETWLNWYKAHHIERIAFGTVTLRRRTAKDNWRCSVWVDKTASEPLGDHILNLFESQYYLNSIKNTNDLLKKKLSPWNLKIEPLSVDYYRASSLVGYLLQIRIHPETALVIASLNGKISLEKAIQVSAKGQKKTFSFIQERVISDIYQLMNYGMLSPVH